MTKKGCADTDVKTSPLLRSLDETKCSGNQELSFLLGEPLPEPGKSAPNLFWIAIAVSLGIHLLILQYHLPSSANSLAHPKPTTSTMVLHLKQQRKSALARDQLQQEKKQEQKQDAIVSQKELPPERSSHDSELAVPAALEEPVPSSAPVADLTPAMVGDIQRVIQTSRYQDVVASPQERVASKNAAFSDVFDPRLRQRLQNNPTHIASVKAQGLTESVNIYGDSEVRLNSGGCMMAKADHSIGGAKDWLMTACSGGEDEGESMLRRVNESLRGQ